MSSDVPSALIADIRASIIADLSKAPSSASASPLPSVATAIASVAAEAADSKGNDATTLRCERCGLSSLLRGTRSAVCIFCCAPVRDTEGIVFSDTTACRWLLDSFGLDGSEPLCSGTENSDSSKAGNSSVNSKVLSDMLHLKLDWHSAKNETAANMNREIPPNTIAASLSGANHGNGTTNFHSEPDARQNPTDRSHSLPGKDNDNVSTESLSEVKIASPSNNDKASTSDSFADWEADFQGYSNKEIAASESKELFQTHVVSKSVVLPDGKLTNIQEKQGELGRADEQANLEGLNTSDSSLPVDITFHDHHDSGGDMFSEKIQSNCTIAVDIGSSGQKPGDQHEISASGWQCTNMSNADGQLESVVVNDQYEVDNVNTLSGSIMASNSSEFSNEVTLDDWQEFTYTERNQVGGIDEITSSSNINDDFDDWSEFSSGQQTGLSNVGAGQCDNVLSLDEPKPPIVEAKNLDAWAGSASTSGMKEYIDINDVNDIILDNGVISTYNSAKDLLEISVDNTNLNKNDEAFDDWQEFITSDGQKAVLPELIKGTDTMGTVGPCDNTNVDSGIGGNISSEHEEFRDISAASWPSGPNTNEFGEVTNNGPADNNILQFWPGSLKINEVKVYVEDGPSQARNMDKFPHSMPNHNADESKVDGVGSMSIFDDWLAIPKNTKSTPIESSNSANNIGEASEDWHEFSAAGAVLSSAGKIRDSNVANLWSGSTSVPEMVESKAAADAEIKIEGLRLSSLKVEDSSIGDNGTVYDWQDFGSRTEEVRAVSSSGTGDMNSTDEPVDDWLEYTSAGEQQVVPPVVFEKLEPTANGHSAEIKILGLPSKNQTTESSNDGGNTRDFFDDWPYFNANSYQGSTSTFSENSGSAPIMRLSDPMSLNLQPADYFKEPKDSTSLKENSDLSDDWAEFVSSDHNIAGSPKHEEIMRTSSQHPKESTPDTFLFTDSSQDIKRSELAEENNNVDNDDDDWQDFSSFGQPQGSLENTRLDNPTIIPLKSNPSSRPIDILSLYDSKEYSDLNSTKVSSTLSDDKQNSTSLSGKSKIPSGHSEFSLEHHAAATANMLYEMENIGILNHATGYKSQSLKNTTTGIPLDLFSSGTNGTHQMDGIDSLASAWDFGNK